MTGHEYPRSVRLCRPAEFTRVYRAGRRIAAGYLQINYATNGEDHARIGMALAKRVFPRAVDRNRAKRLIRSRFRQHGQQLPAIDIVVSLRGGKQRGVPKDLDGLLDGLWQRLATL